MRKLTFLLAFMLAMVISSFTYGQYLSVSATYTAGDIGTDDEFDQFGEASTCPGLLNVPVPNGAVIAEVDVTYDMTATAPASIAQQRSQMWIDVGGGAYVTEPEIYRVSIYNPGVQNYSRTGWDVAGQVPPPIFGMGINFELHAGSIYYNAPVGCSTATNKVDDGTWTVTVWYLPIGSPDFPKNPIPADGQLLVDINADLIWDTDNNTDTYDVFLGTDNPPTTQVVFDGPASGGTGTYDPGTMPYGTTYYWYAVNKNAINNTAGKVWTFTTECDVATMPIVETFEGIIAPEFPACWVPLTNSTDQYTRVLTVLDTYGNAHSDTTFVKYKADAHPSPELILVLPIVGTVSDKYISFWAKNGVDWTSQQPFPIPLTIGTMSDPMDAATFTAHSTYYGLGEWTYFETYLSDYVGSDQYIAIRGDVAQYEETYLDDVSVDYIPSCIHPIDMEMTLIENDQAEISWTDMNGATEWEIEIDTAGFTPSGIATNTATTNPYTITGLTGDEEYDVYMRANCGGGDYSIWWGPVTFTSLCDAFVLPIYEDLEAVEINNPENNWPGCWFKIVEATHQYGGIWVNNVASYPDVQQVFYMDAGSGDFYPDAKTMAVSPEISDDITTMRLRFSARTGSPNATPGLLIGTLSNPTDGSTFTVFDSVPITTQWEVYTVYFDTYVGTDTHIGINPDMSLAGTNGAILHVDNLLFEVIPSCIEPENVYTDNPTASSAWLNWEDLNPAADFEIEVGALGFAPGTSTYEQLYNYNTTPAAIQSYEMTGLSSSTTYDAYIRTNCGGGDYSVWVGPVSFMTALGPVALPVYEDFESGLGMTGNQVGNPQDWVINTNLYVSGANSVHNPYSADGDNSLLVLGIFDFTAKADIMLSFQQIAKTDGNYDPCYVEISTDGGVTFDQLPESTYFGGGDYTVPQYNNPEGPAFDEDSYTDWGTSNTIPENTWWKKEYFDLTDYNTFTEVVIRFRLTSNGYTHRNGWYIDDVALEAIGTSAFNVDPLSITEDGTATMSMVNVDMTLGNTGSFPASYTAEVIYDEVYLLAENFDGGIPGTWTINHYGTMDSTWTGYVDFSGYTFDDTPFAICNGQTSNENKPLIVNDELVSPVIDASAYIGATLHLEFDQAFDHYYNAEDTARVLVYDGTDWIEIYKAWNDDGRLTSSLNGVHKVYNVSQYANANFQVKFVYEENNSIDRYGYYYAIDNFRLRASMYPLGWLTVDGAEVTNGVTLPDADGFAASIVTANMDATGLAIGTYTADILVTSNDAGNPSTLVPVTMNVLPEVAIDMTIFLAGRLSLYYRLHHHMDLLKI